MFIFVETLKQCIMNNSDGQIDGMVDTICLLEKENEQLKEITSQIDEPLLELLDEINYMRKLYANSHYGKSEEVMNEITNKLDDIRRKEFKPNNK